MSEALNPCPFCGSSDIDTDSYFHLEYCTNCGARGPAAWCSPKAHWNTRVDLPPTLSAAMEHAGDVALMLKCEAVIIAQRTRIAQLEAMLPRAYQAGVEATEIRSCNWVNRDCLDMPEDTGLSLYIRALTIPTSAELLAKLKETK